ncbi:TetR/AcrR family transcriptional regulator [Geovibrio thiophilus]|uniref:TetR/AcrR family transcriptional regulator n=1 Tax=Geovibrio thiophilus TaxID=139438 RepID=A0A410JYI8_9BACT|nr:TetR/AcrR family transcriptional regulator [Geovibrio thiophilus]QAR33224.1 TetR/AcrR family transcriptional regulator [Geovibrio thiophilus]
MARKKKDTKLRILELSAALFADKGKDAVGIREIAEKSGVSLNTVMYHFSSKENLHHETIKYLLANGINFGEIFRKKSENTSCDCPAEMFRGIISEIFAEGLKPKYATYINMISKVIFSRDKTQLTYLLESFQETELHFTGFFEKTGIEADEKEMSFLMGLFWTQLLYSAGARKLAELESVHDDSADYAAKATADIFLQRLGVRQASGVR